MSFIGLPATSQQGRALETQTIRRLPRTGRQTGAQGTRSCGDYDISRWHCESPRFSQGLLGSPRMHCLREIHSNMASDRLED